MNVLFGIHKDGITFFTPTTIPRVDYPSISVPTAASPPHGMDTSSDTAFSPQATGLLRSASAASSSVDEPLPSDPRIRPLVPLPDGPAIDPQLITRDAKPDAGLLRFPHVSAPPPSPVLETPGGTIQPLPNARSFDSVSPCTDPDAQDGAASAAKAANPANASKAVTAKRPVVRNNDQPARANTERRFYYRISTRFVP